MDLISSPSRHVVPMFAPYGKACRQSPSSNGSAGDHRQNDYISPTAPSRPFPRSFNTFPIVDQPSTWNNAYHQILTNFPNPSVAERPEHSLRRKTPNGTIDNGYDGTPTQLAGGPPPQKYLGSTPSGDVFPNANSGRPIPVASNSSWFPSSQSARGTHDEAASLHLMTPGVSGFGQGTLGYSPIHGPILSSPTVQMHPLSLGPGMRNGFGNAYQNQTLASPSVMSPVIGFNSANTIWADGPLGGFHPGVQMSSTGYPPHNVPYESGFGALQAPLPQGPLGGYGYGQNLPFPMLYMPDDGFSRHALPSMIQSSHRLQNLSLGSNPTSAGDGSPQNFREGVLASSHKAYSDLVAHVTRLKKVQHGKSSSRSLKSIIFPRPPKHLISRPTSHLSRTHQTFPGAVNGYAHRQIPPAINGPIIQPRSLGEMFDAHLMGSTRLDGTGHTFGSHPTAAGAVYGNAMLPSHPRENAKASLDMLTNLCEQTEWKWIDGMLMGGCLHYSLEHYEESLEWFKRIVTLDAE